MVKRTQDSSKSKEGKSNAKEDDKTESTSTSVKKEEAAKPLTPAQLFRQKVESVQQCVALVERSASINDVKFTLRALRRIASVRRVLSARVLAAVYRECIVAPARQSLRETLLGALESVKGNVADMEVDDDEAADKPKGDEKKERRGTAGAAKSPHLASLEVETYLAVLVVVFLIDQKQVAEAVGVTGALLDLLDTQRWPLPLFPLGAKAYFYFSYAHELARTHATIRPRLLAALKSAALRHDDEGQATLLNLLMRSYLADNLYSQAFKLMSHVDIRHDAVSSNQLARLLYYEGRIKATQLDYSSAQVNLMQAIRKAPQTTAFGFRCTVHKALVIVELLMGMIPERTVFEQEGMHGALRPYFELTLAVRRGDLKQFEAATKTHAELFTKDGNMTLVRRLRRNVIKAGLRRISVSYSRISLADIARKLELESAADAEFIVARAIHDGVIEAEIDHEGQFMRSVANLDVYSTYEPTRAYDSRVQVCHKIHNDAIKAMQYPEAKQKLADELENIERDQRSLTVALQEELDEEDDDAMDDL